MNRQSQGSASFQRPHTEGKRDQIAQHQRARLANPATVPGFTSQVCPPRTHSILSISAQWLWPQNTAS